MAAQQDKAVRERVIGPDELAAELDRAAIAPAQSASATAGPSLSVIVGNVGYNRYTIQLAEPASAGADPTPIADALVTAVNAAEPFDEAGELEEGAVVLVWPGQGDWEFSCPRPVEPPEPPAATSYWAKIVSGGGPAYTVRRQVPADDDSFQDAAESENVSAANVWELTVGTGATAPVPADVVVRVFEEPDAGETTRRFFFYPIHAVYR